MNKSKIRLAVKVANGKNDAGTIRLTGRNAWALKELMRCQENGCTPINNPAPRWSAYIYNLRQAGIRVETITEPHGGAFSGTHARYVMHSRITECLEG